MKRQRLIPSIPPMRSAGAFKLLMQFALFAPILQMAFPYSFPRSQRELRAVIHIAG